MKVWIRLFFAALFLAIPTTWANGEENAASAETLYCGVAAADITPPLKFRLRGYFEERQTSAIHDPLFAKAMVFQQNKKTAVIMTCDVVSVPNEATSVIRRKIKEQLGIPTEAIIITSTHTHTGPLFCGPLHEYLHAKAIEENGSDPCETMDYLQFFIERGIEAINKAYVSLRPTRLELGMTEVTHLSFNRRFKMKDGSVMFNPGFDNPDKVAPAAGIDPDFPILLFEDAATGKPYASLTSFALHLDTTEGTEVSADYPFYLSNVLKEKFGEDFLSIFAVGTCGDINHLDFAKGNKPRVAREIGTELGNIARAQIENGLSPVTPDLDWVSLKRPWPRQSFTPEELEKSKGILHAAVVAGGEGVPFLERAKAVNVLSLAAFPEMMTLEVQAIRLSKDFAFVSLPGEIFVDLGQAIKKSSPFEKTVILEMAHEDINYVPTRKAFGEGSYETIDSVVAPGGGERLVEMAQEALKTVSE